MVVMVKLKSLLTLQHLVHLQALLLQSSLRGHTSVVLSGAGKTGMLMFKNGSWNIIGGNDYTTVIMIGKYYVYYNIKELENHRQKLSDDFDELKNNIGKVEVDLGTMKSNLNKPNELAFNFLQT